MAAKVGIAENGVATADVKGNVTEIKKEWSVIEDGALAHRLQEEENVNHYSGNISRRRTVRSDIKTAKSAADEEAISAFKEEHEIVEKNRKIELEDEEAAKKLLQEMMEEEKRKLRELRQKENEEADREAAKQLYLKMMADEKKKTQKQKSFEETDAELAMRLHAHEEKKRQILSKRQQSIEYEEDDERLARQLAKEEQMRYKSTPQSPHGIQEDDDNYMVPDVKGLKVTDSQEAPSRGGKHQPKQASRSSAHSQQGFSNIAHDDSDEETDIIAKIQDDEELARRLQREEVQKSRAPPQLSEKQRQQLIHDQKIAIKMQHEEVMFSKKKNYDNYMGKVRDEIADPEPMVLLSRQNQVAVPVDAKFSDNVQLTDYTAGEGAQHRRTSASGQPGNIAASLDPTFRGDAGNVVLLKKTSLTEEPIMNADGSFAPVQGTRRKDSKDNSKKRSSFFSKLKKK
ncbi:trichohyalin-like isoform X2 [Asterias rubens]|uniref:trichohyalin-like isoform X2 n=1 Tax=Asterias rubens TaxID=7604 RepID=UPI001455059A|nr:trichohyalin-like isoform X2 [Asterias rubens]